MVMPPVGYKRPNFPSLYFPLGRNEYDYESSFLYRFKDIWMFTTVWTIIWMTGLYLACSIIILITHSLIIRQNMQTKTTQTVTETGVDESTRIVTADEINNNPVYKNYFTNSILSGNKNTVFITVFGYIIVGAFQGFLSGSIVGIVLGAIYDSAQFRMTTWIPFIFSLMITLYNISSAYPFTVKGL